jgi:hypothetical protein
LAERPGQNTSGKINEGEIRKMGSRQKRELLASGMRFRDGKLIPASVIESGNYVKPYNSDPIMRCRLCGNGVPQHFALQHVKDCWNITYEKLADVPKEPPSEARAFYLRNHPAK